MKREKQIPHQEKVIINKSTCATIPGTPGYYCELIVTEVRSSFKFHIQFFGLCKNFQAVMHDFVINWGTNKSWHRVHIPLVIHQYGKEKRTHKANEGEVYSPSYVKQ